MLVHLAAQAGVRYGIENPMTYLDADIVGTLNSMDCARTTTPTFADGTEVKRLWRKH